MGCKLVPKITLCHTYIHAEILFLLFTIFEMFGILMAPELCCSMTKFHEFKLSKEFHTTAKLKQTKAARTATSLQDKTKFTLCSYLRSKRCSCSILGEGTAADIVMKRDWRKLTRYFSIFLGCIFLFANGHVLCGRTHFACGR